jgi:hypothetical protein
VLHYNVITCLLLLVKKVRIANSCMYVCMYPKHDQFLEVCYENRVSIETFRFRPKQTNSRFTGLEEKVREVEDFSTM